MSVEGLYKQYKNYDMSPEEINERCEAEMDAQYKLETEGLEEGGRGRAGLRVDDEGLPGHAEQGGSAGFCQTEDRNQMKIQRHLVRLMQLIAQEMKEKKMI